MRLHPRHRAEDELARNKDASFTESEESKSGVILDYDAGGNLLSLEVLDASQRVEDPTLVKFSTRG